MRLLAVSPWCPWPPMNGSQQRLYFLLGELSRTHEISLVCGDWAGDATDAPAALSDRCARVEVVPHRGRRDARWPWLSATPRSLVNDHDPAMQARVTALLPDHDLALGFSIGSALYLQHTRGCPTVLEELEVSVIRERGDRSPAAGNRIRHQLTWLKLAGFARRLFDRFDGITVATERERTYLVEIGGDRGRITVVPNAAPPVQRIEPPRGASSRLVYPGSPTYWANLAAVAWMADAILPAIRARRADVTVSVTGSLTGLDRARLPSADGLTYAGVVDDIDRHIAESGACVVPLREGGGSRLKVLHALAVGTPVVSTTKGVEGLPLESGRDVLVADTVTDFADAVCRVLEDEALRTRLRIRGLELAAERFTWAQSGRALETALAAARRRWMGRFRIEGTR